MGEKTKQNKKMDKTRKEKYERQIFEKRRYDFKKEKRREIRRR